MAVLDWEISGIGAQLLDLGWLLMMNDTESWSDGAGLAAVPPFDRLVATYAAAVGRSVSLDDVAWYRALSGYRFGVISCFNVMLPHRQAPRSGLGGHRHQHPGAVRSGRRTAHLSRHSGPRTPEAPPSPANR